MRWKRTKTIELRPPKPLNMPLKPKRQLTTTKTEFWSGSPPISSDWRNHTPHLRPNRIRNPHLHHLRCLLPVAPPMFLLPPMQRWACCAARKRLPCARSAFSCCLLDNWQRRKSCYFVVIEESRRCDFGMRLPLVLIVLNPDSIHHMVETLRIPQFLSVSRVSAGQLASMAFMHGVSLYRRPLCGHKVSKDHKARRQKQPQKRSRDVGDIRTTRHYGAIIYHAFLMKIKYSAS
jgi:hypothetical protein